MERKGRHVQIPAMFNANITTRVVWNETAVCSNPSHVKGESGSKEQQLMCTKRQHCHPGGKGGGEGECIVALHYGGATLQPGL